MTDRKTDISFIADLESVGDSFPISINFNWFDREENH